MPDSDSSVHFGNISVHSDLGEHRYASTRERPEVIPFLQPSEISANRAYCGFAEDVDAELMDVAEKIRNDASLSELAWHCFWLIFKGPKMPPTANWPDFKDQLGDQGGIFYLLVSLGMVPLIREHHKRMGIPEQITVDTVGQVKCYSENYQRGHDGRHGAYLCQINWLRHYVLEPYFRIGRFEYWLKKHNGAVVVYRNRKTGAVVALSKADVRFNEHGYHFRECDGLGEANAWTSTLQEKDDAAVGNPISPLGMVLRKEIRLPLSEWEPALREGDRVLDLHIPPGGGMKMEVVAESKRQAAAFFEKHFPDEPWAAMVCVSWMFNTQLEEILAPESNLVRYMREVYLCPAYAGETGGLWFIFLQEPFDAATAPRDTRLQRDILAYLEKGNVWRGGAMLFMREHLDRFGEQYYRKHSDPEDIGL